MTPIMKQVILNPTLIAINQVINLFNSIPPPSPSPVVQPFALRDDDFAMTISNHDTRNPGSSCPARL